MRRYDFDEIIDRRGTNALNTDGFRGYIFRDDGGMTFPYKDEDLIRMWVADMDFATPDVIIDAIRERLDRRIFGYTKIFDDSYYDAFVGWTKRRYGWSFPREQLYTSNGVVPALNALVRLICRPSDKVLITTPSYAPFKSSAELNGHDLVCSDLLRDGTTFKLDFDDLERKASDPLVSLFIFCNPHNPTGRVWTRDELARVGAIMRSHGVTIISDEIHCDLTRTGIKHTPLASVVEDSSDVVTCMAPSKTFNLAGLLFSNVIIGDRALAARWREQQSAFVDPLSLAAAQAAYSRGDEWLEQLASYLDDNFRYTRDFLREHLPQSKFEIPEATYLAWVDLAAYIPPDAGFLPLFFANGAGVLLEGGNMFVANSDGFVRLNVACPRKTLAAGLERIAHLLAK